MTSRTPGAQSAGPGVRSRPTIRLVALDIDGTLLDSKGKVPEANRRALCDATDRGVEVVLVTGRRFDFTRHIVEQIDSPLTLIVSNGALVKSRQGSTLRSWPLARGQARHVLEATSDFRANAALVFDRVRENQVVFEKTDARDPVMQRYFERNREFSAEVAPLEHALDAEDPIQIMFAGSVVAMRQLEARLQSLERSSTCSIALTDYSARDLLLVDAVAHGCSKGAALAAWAARLGIIQCEVMAIGDNLNDADMLEFAGLPIVMGNGVAELKARGWTTTATHDEAGVAVAIERFITGGNPGCA